MIADEQEFVDRKQAAAYYGVTKETIRAWMRKGWLPAPLILPNGKARWTMAMLKAAIKRSAA